MLTRVQRGVVTVITQGLLYGVYVATLIQCFRWFIFTDDGWKPWGKISSFTMAFRTIFIFLMTTTSAMTMLAYVVKLLSRDGMWQTVTGNAMVMTISEDLAIISIDAVMIYRWWIQVVFAKSWRAICVPVTFWLASLACSIWIWYYQQIEYHSQYPTQLGLAARAITSRYACNIATTTYTTIAIIYRILCTRKISSCRSKRLNYIMRILADSGVLYTSTMIFSLVGSLLTGKSDPTWVDDLIYDISDAINFSMAGISFNLLLIRVYQTRSRVERRDSLADSRNDDRADTLSGMRFNNLQITASSEGLPSNMQPVDEVIDEIQEHGRSNDGMHVN